jgi:hypothetical protein
VPGFQIAGEGSAPATELRVQQGTGGACALEEITIGSNAGARGFALVVWTTAAAVLGIVVFTAVAGLVNVMAVAGVAAFAAIAAATVLVVRRVDLSTTLAGVPRWARRCCWCSWFRSPRS